MRGCFFAMLSSREYRDIVERTHVIKGEYACSGKGVLRVVKRVMIIQ